MEFLPLPIKDLNYTKREKNRISKSIQELQNWNKFWNKFWKENILAIDLGANIGLYSLHYLMMGMNVHAFEPSLNNKLKLLKLCDKFKNFHLHEYAISNENFKDYLLFNDCSDYTKNLQEITFVKFDEYIKKNNLIPDFIKMDIEGFEYKAILEMENTITKICPFWQIEIHPPFQKNIFNIFFDYYFVYNDKFEIIKNIEIKKNTQFFFIPKGKKNFLKLI